MNCAALRQKHVSLFAWRPRLAWLWAGCMIVDMVFMTASSAGQSTSAALGSVVKQSSAAPQSIITLAPSPGPAAESIAPRVGDATFANAPANYHVFPATTAREGTGAEVLTLNFAGETTLTRIKSTSKDFVLEPGGTCLEGVSYVRGESCSLLVRFNPQGPGHRLGFLSITNSAEVKPASFGLTGNGYSPAISFTPSVITTVPGSVSSGAGTLSGATNLAIDGGDIVYIADTGNNRVKEIDPSGNITTSLTNPISTPASLAVDSFGDVYTANVHSATYYFSIYYPWGTQTAYGFTYTPGTCTPGAPCSFASVGMYYPANMSIDAYNDLFFEEGTQGAAEMPVGSISGGSGTLNLWYLSDQFAYSSGKPGSFAADAYGNLYTAYNFSTSTCYLIQEPLYNAEYSPTANRVAGGVNCGFSGDGGQARGAEISATIGQIAFDVAGDLYFADAGNQRVRRIDYNTGIIRTIAGNGTAGYTGDGGAATSAQLNNPTGVGVDSQGNVYIISSATSGQVIRKVGVTGLLTFGNQGRGTTSSTRIVTVTNSGNATMQLTSFGISGTNGADFKVNPLATSCVLTAGATLNVGQTCTIGVTFTPSGGGSRSATLILVNNTVNGVNNVSLSGTGILPAPTFKITAPANGASFTSGTAVTFSASVTSTSGTQPTGTVQFKVDGANYGSAVTLSPTGTASTSVTGLTTTTHTLSATYSGDSNYAAAGPISVTITVTAAAKVSFLSPMAGQIFAPKTSIPLAVMVTANSGPAPTGTVKFLVDANLAGSATIISGKASVNAGLLPAGTHTVVAEYSGDKYHLATSASEKITVSP